MIPETPERRSHDYVRHVTAGRQTRPDGPRQSQRPDL
jgi:hypothetical protein